MQEKQLKIFDDLETAVDKFIADFQKMVPDANKQILAELNDFIATLKKRSNGSLQASVENLKLIDKYFSTFDKIISNTDYGQGVTDFVKTFKESTGYVNEYFSTAVFTFQDNKELYKQIIDANINTTVDKLIGSGVDANFSYPLKELLKDNVKNGTNTINLRKTIEKKVIGFEETPGSLTRYSKQVANDSIRQFNRNYIQTLSNDLGLKYYYFRGTKTDDTRKWCASKKGKYFTEEEVLSWAHQKWAGRMDGTNEQNIKTNLGGWGCKDDLIPVSKEIYEANHR